MNIYIFNTKVNTLNMTSLITPTTGKITMLHDPDGWPQTDVKHLLTIYKKDKSLISKQLPGTGGYLPLHYAVCKGAKKEVIEKLVELYPDACRVSDEETKYTPLHCAALTGRSDVMKLLLKTYPEAAAMRNGWKMCKTCRDGKIPLDIARAMNKKECVKILEPVSPPEPTIPMWIWWSLLFCIVGYYLMQIVIPYYHHYSKKIQNSFIEEQFIV